MNLKKLLSSVFAFILVFYIFFSCFNVTVSSASQNFLFYTNDPVTDTIIDGVYAHQESIDISSYAINKDKLGKIMYGLFNAQPALFFMASNYSYTLNGSGEILSLKPVYTMDKSEADSKKADFLKRMNDILSQVDKNLSDVEKVLFVHDYLCTHFEYDLSLTIADSYNFLTQGKGVCAAYSKTFLGLMLGLGIECDIAYSINMNHSWNRVKLGGKWYHVDVTFDDPKNGIYGFAYHGHLLLSDDAIQTENKDISRSRHYDYEMFFDNTPSSSTTYDTSVWTGIKTPFVKVDNSWYYIGKKEKISAIYKTNLSTTSAVFDLSYKWKVPDKNSYYTDFFSGLSNYKGKLVFNSFDTIFVFDVNALTATEVFKLASTETKKIFGSLYDNNKIYYALQTDFNGNDKVIKSTEIVVVGDSNGDFVVNFKDVAVLNRLLAAGDVPYDANMDINKDKVVDQKDYQLMRNNMVD